MELKIARGTLNNDVEVITLSGTMNAVTVSGLKELLKKCVAENSVQIVIDLDGVNFIDSSGLSSLISALKGCREKGGYLRLARIQSPVKRVFELTMLDRVFEMYPTVEAAARCPVSGIESAE
jgi:anti-anti-sigma factor